MPALMLRHARMACTLRSKAMAAFWLFTPPTPQTFDADGVRIVLKAMGKTPFAMGRGASSIDVVATPEQVGGLGFVKGLEATPKVHPK